MADRDYLFERHTEYERLVQEIAATTDTDPGYVREVFVMYAKASGLDLFGSAERVAEHVAKVPDA